MYTFIWYLVGAIFPLEIMYKSENWWIHKLYQAYTYYMPGIYQKYFEHSLASLNLILSMSLLYNIDVAIHCYVYYHLSPRKPRICIHFYIPGIYLDIPGIFRVKTSKSDIPGTCVRISRPGRWFILWNCSGELNPIPFPNGEQ